MSFFAQYDKNAMRVAKNVFCHLFGLGDKRDRIKDGAEQKRRLARLFFQVTENSRFSHRRPG